MEKPKILFFDLETAGVQGLKADRGFVVCFGYRWAWQKKAQVITILDCPGKHCQDDTNLLKYAYEIMSEAEALVAHYGENFDRPYLEARFLKAGLPPIPDYKLTDTCLISRKKFAISSSRLGNVAEFFNIPVKKMEKRSGWPMWWLGALRGDRQSIRDMAVYCAQDVDCLYEYYQKIKSRIPSKYLPINRAIGGALWTCSCCGGHRKNSRGYYWSEKKQWQRYQCQECGKWSRSQKAIAGEYKDHSF